MKKLLKWTGIGCGGLMALFVIIGIIIAVAAGGKDAPATPAEAVKSIVKANDKVTMEKYNQIKTGMSYTEVVQIMGTEGKEQSRAETNGTKLVFYAWANPDGSSLVASFTNDKLDSKTQAGLK